jgi:hypothetical protein
MSDVYRIGMQIVLAGNAVHGLQQIATLLGGIHGHVGRIHAGFRGWAAVLGVGAVGAGVGIIGGLKNPVAEELQEPWTGRRIHRWAGRPRYRSIRVRSTSHGFKELTKGNAFKGVEMLKQVPSRPRVKTPIRSFLIF